MLLRSPSPEIRQSPISKKLLLQEFLSEVGRLEQGVEEMRVEGAEDSKFNIYEAFRYFDREGRGKVYMRDIRIGLADLDYISTDSDIALLLKRFDRDGDGALRFSEFS